MKTRLAAVNPTIWLALLMLWSAPAAFAQDGGDAFTLETLMDALSKVQSIDAAFREVKEVALLDEPVILTGILRYRAPDYVLKKALLPRREGVEITGDTLLIDSPEHGRRSVRLDDYPAVQAFVESFRATLAGDLEALQRYYRIALDGSFEHWRLRLEPIDPAMAEHVEAIRIRGRQDRVLRIATQQVDGGRSVMTITPSN